MATKREDGNKGRKVREKGQGNINQKDTPWGGGSDVVRPYADGKSGKGAGVDKKVFDLNASNDIPLVAEAGKKGNGSNVSGRLFPEADTNKFDGGGEKVARPYDAGKKTDVVGKATD